MTDDGRVAEADSHFPARARRHSRGSIASETADRGKNTPGVLPRPRYHSNVDEPRELGGNSHWRLAVRDLRVSFGALRLGIVGLVTMLAGSARWVLVGGATLWVIGGALTSVEFYWARHQLPEPRPGYWPMRFWLMRDSLHAREETTRD